MEDAVDATLTVGVHPKALGEVFNVASGIETRVNQLHELINNLGQYWIEPTYDKKRDIDNIRRRVINIDKAKALLNWEPDYNLVQGLGETIKWYKKYRYGREN